MIFIFYIPINFYKAAVISYVGRGFFMPALGGLQTVRRLQNLIKVNYSEKNFR